MTNIHYDVYIAFGDYRTKNNDTFSIHLLVIINNVIT